ncbi:MAG: hypothetical protein KJP23_15965 [Deltaproteobacteria bacterium]|nr:hypothetical protein [Deltaproteobacteria bacterium]
MRSYIHISIFFFITLIFVFPHSITPRSAWDSKDQETSEAPGFATFLKNHLFTKSFDKASVVAWKELITMLIEKGETQHAKRVSWILLFHPRTAGRRAGAMALINTYDLSDPHEVSSLLSIDNDCLRTTFVDLAEDGYFIKFPIAPQMAELLEDERYLRKHRQGRLVKILRALYHYSDKSVVSSVAEFLYDPSKKVREVTARTLGKLTGHKFSRTGDMDLTPPVYYVEKAKIWWLLNKSSPEYKSNGKRQEQERRAPDLTEQTPENFLRTQVAHLQDKDFLVWAAAFNRLLEFGVEHESSFLINLLESASGQEVDATYTETLIRLIEFYNKKRKTLSEYIYRKNYDINEYCPQ